MYVIYLPEYGLMDTYNDRPIGSHIRSKQEAQLLHRGHAMLCVIEYFAKYRHVYVPINIPQ